MDSKNIVNVSVLQLHTTQQFNIRLEISMKIFHGIVGNCWVMKASQTFHKVHWSYLLLTFMDVYRKCNKRNKLSIKSGFAKSLNLIFESLEALFEFNQSWKVEASKQEKLFISIHDEYRKSGTIFEWRQSG